MLSDAGGQADVRKLLVRVQIEHGEVMDRAVEGLLDTLEPYERGERDRRSVHAAAGVLCVPADVVHSKRPNLVK